MSKSSVNFIPFRRAAPVRAACRAGSVPLRHGPARRGRDATPPPRRRRWQWDGGRGDEMGCEERGGRGDGGPRPRPPGPPARLACVGPSSAGTADARAALSTTPRLRALTRGGATAHALAQAHASAGVLARTRTNTHLRARALTRARAHAGARRRTHTRTSLSCRRDASLGSRPRPPPGLLRASSPRREQP